MKMETKDELKEIDIKNRTGYNFDALIFAIEILILVIYYSTKNYAKKNKKMF